jgi:hypothetical protein
MTLPGTIVRSRANSPGASSDIDTGTWFAAGFTERGSLTQPVLVRDMDEYTRKLGGRETGYTTLYDAADVFFREGGSRLVVSRVFGPSPGLATVTLDDSGAVDSIRVDAKNPGAWGADLDVIIAAGDVGGSFTITIEDDDVVVESSGDLLDVAEAVAWGASSEYVTITALGANDPDVGSFSLTGGTDDKSNATDATWEAALTRITKDQGPGQVSMPGRTTAQAHQDTLEHADSHNRRALLDYTDSSNESTLVAAAATDRALGDEARSGAGFAPWAVVPGIAAGTTRTVPWSAVQAGLIARSEAAGNSPNVAAAGDNGQAQYVIGLSQDAWTDAERETLNDGGVNVALLKNGTFRTYGYRTLADPDTDPAYVQFTAARTLMAIAADGEQVLERFMFAEIDGKGRKLAELAGQLIGVCLPYYSAGSLYGDTPSDAFRVDVGAEVNTPEDLAAGQVTAVITLRISPFAEVVILELVKTEITEVLA